MKMKEKPFLVCCLVHIHVYYIYNLNTVCESCTINYMNITQTSSFRKDFLESKSMYSTCTHYYNIVYSLCLLFVFDLNFCTKYLSKTQHNPFGFCIFIYLHMCFSYFFYLQFQWRRIERDVFFIIDTIQNVIWTKWIAFANSTSLEKVR